MTFQKSPAAPPHPECARPGRGNVQQTAVMKAPFVRRTFFLSLLCAATVCSLPAARAQSVPGPEILQELRNFDQLGSVLYVAAHPDDENTQLLTYLARGRNYRTAYLLTALKTKDGQFCMKPQVQLL